MDERKTLTGLLYGDVFENILANDSKASGHGLKFIKNVGTEVLLARLSKKKLLKEVTTSSP